METMERTERAERPEGRERRERMETKETMARAAHVEDMECVKDMECAEDMERAERSVERLAACAAAGGWRVSAAESCTGGRIAAALTGRSGASTFFEGGVVAYQDGVKERLLGVPPGLIARCGVVSREVAEAMVRGACRLFGTDYALASTGYAEPWQGHGVEIWVAWGGADEVRSACLRHDGGRLANVERAARRALAELAKWVEERG